MQSRSQMIKPDPQDYAEIERTYGRLPANATDQEAVHQYRRAQMAKLVRLYGRTTTAAKPVD